MARGVWFSIEVLEAGSSVPKAAVRLSKGRCRVGSSLRNDLILLDRSVRARAGEFVRRGFGLVWKDGTTGDEIPALQADIPCGVFRLRARRSWKPLWAIPPAGLTAALVLAQIVSLGAATPAPSPTVADSRVTSLPAKGTFGPLAGSRKGAPLEFSFEWDRRDDLELHYSAYGIQELNQLSVELNGKRIGFVAPCFGQWSVEERIRVPWQRLRADNRLVFRDEGRAPRSAPWALRDVYVVRASEKPSEPENPDVLLSAAEKLFRLRSAQAGQLVRARQLVERAVRLWNTERGAIPKEAMALQFEIRKAEEAMISEGMAEARSAASMGQRRKALEIYKRLDAELIEPEDPRKSAIEKARKELRP